MGFKSLNQLCLHLIFLLLATLGRAEAATLYGVILLDLNANDISNTVLIDHQRVTYTLQQIADRIGMEHHQILLKCGENRPRDILNTLRTLETHPEDVVVFYFGGHGFRFSTQTSVWPLLYDSRACEILPLDHVIDTLAQKSQHLTLIIADCCNNIVTPKITHAFEQPRAFIHDSQITQNFSKLFIQEEGMWVAIGAEPGLYSYCDKRVGGYFTHALIRALYELPSQRSEPTWDEILHEACRRIQKYQKPYFIKLGH